MGQYYHPIVLKKDGKHIEGFIYTHEVGSNGLKLMEHSYIDNKVCNVMENYLKRRGGARVVWAGDYADPEPVKLKKEEALAIWKNMVATSQTETSFAQFYATDKRACVLDKDGDFVGENLYGLSGEKYNDNDKVIRRAKPKLYELDDKGEYFKRDESGEYVKDENGRRIPCFNEEEKHARLVELAQNTEFRFLINDDRKEYVDLWEVPNVDGYRVHPLPLLTCEGNGRGGGDYHGLNNNMVGIWARNFIRVAEHNWELVRQLEKDGYKKIVPNFMETYSIKSDLSHLASYIAMAMQDLEHSSDPYFVGEVRKAAKDILAVLPKVSPEEARVMKK